MLSLHFTYWVLLFTTLISSCFLFYAVTAENVGYETNNRYASVASHTSTPSTTETITSEQNATTNATEAGDKNTQRDDASFNEHTTEQVLPNYKKLKKDLHEQESKLQAVDKNVVDIPTTLPSLATESVLSSPSVVKSVEISETNNVIESSDSVVDHDVDNNSDRVDNKNVFNTIEKNENTIHSTNVKPTDNDLQLPDVNMQAGDRTTEQRVQDSTTDIPNDLPDITDIPTVTVTELPLEVLQQPQNTLDSVIIDDGGDRSKEERVNGTIEVMAGTKEDIKKDDQIVKINDSGGEDGDGYNKQPTAPTASFTGENQDVPLATNNIPTDTNDISTTQSSMNVSIEQQQQQQQQHQQQEQNTSSTASNSQVNLTAVEEVPMPVFSEWAQKQMEAAEKQQALEQEQNVNNSAQRKNNTNGNGKPTSLKIRAKNYASPDCGAKIIAASAYTSNSGAVLSSSKDEYMLSLCGNRIWFVVELCEAIQAQKIELANFELYSSSPQNFTVAVSKRFPTREWSNVGRFAAEDKRAVQSFDLHPHLFGKFVRVNINSHYSKEHFCTLSLFRVFGTSEFEAFETENHPNEDLDDFDEEYLFEQNTVKHTESNLFKSASDAVLSIVKKATEVLGKPANNQNQTFKISSQSVVCRTPIYGLFSCAECPTSLVEKVNTILSCEFSQLNLLLSNKYIRNDLLNTRVCAKLYGIETNHVWPIQKDFKNSFYVNVLPNEYVGALCQLLAKAEGLSHKSYNSVPDEDKQPKEAADLSSNLTIDKKFGEEDLNLLDHPEKKLIKPDITTLPVDPAKSPVMNSPATEDTSRKQNPNDNQQLPRPLEPIRQSEATNLPPKNIPNLPDTNIFNVPADELSSETEVPVAVLESSSSTENIEDTVASTPAPITTSTSMPVPNIESATPPPKSEEDSNSWDNIEHLLTTVPSNIAAGYTIGSVTHNQQKNSNGPQSESVFIRLSNRIKALERNMSLSGQYLEELSRRYKKQVEELQQTLTQQMQTVRALEEENRRHHELEQSYALRNVQLQDELDNLVLQVHACIVVIIFVGAFVFLVLIVAILFYRSLRRETKEVISLYDKENRKKKDSTISTTKPHKNINRRKSFEDFSDHRQLLQGCNPDFSNVTASCGEKFRRPSEEVMLILKDYKNNGGVICQQQQSEYEKLEEEIGASLNNSSTARQRKISVCYGSNNNINQSNNQYSNGMPPQQPPKSLNKRRGEKHSWPNTARAQLQAWSHLEELKAEEHIGDSAGISSMSLKRSTILNGKSKKKKETLKRQQSSPTGNSDQHNNHTVTEFKGSEFDQRLLLDEDDLDNFIPNTDLAYNEFMPDGPRGYQCINPNPNANKPASKKIPNKQLDKNLKKSRHLSSPVFFKSPFTKSFKGKLSNSNKTNPAHESTSWEWYRLKKSTSSASSFGGGVQISNSIPANSTNNDYLGASPNVSLDSSSLSEINFPTNSTENSFRILEEAILSSGESAITTTTASSNKKSSGGLSSSSNSNRSSSSNSSAQSKKKSRSFNKIFRKVF